MLLIPYFIYNNSTGLVGENGLNSYYTEDFNLVLLIIFFSFLILNGIFQRKITDKMT